MPESQLNDTFGIEEPILLGVADGIGGHKAGDIASDIAVSGLSARRFADRDALASELQTIDTTLLAQGSAADTFRMGTTFCGMLLGPQPVGVVIGDGFLAVRSGRALQPFGPSWDDIAESTTITSALGGREASTLPRLALSWREMPFAIGARYVIASDGIVRALSYESFAESIRVGNDPTECLERIFSLALTGAAPDNITCIIAEVMPES